MIAKKKTIEINGKRKHFLSSIQKNAGRSVATLSYDIPSLSGGGREYFPPYNILSRLQGPCRVNTLYKNAPYNYIYQEQYTGKLW